MTRNFKRKSQQPTNKFQNVTKLKKVFKAIIMLLITYREAAKYGDFASWR